MRRQPVEDDVVPGAALRAGLSQDGQAVDWAREAMRLRTDWPCAAKPPVAAPTCRLLMAGNTFAPAAPYLDEGAGGPRRRSGEERPR